MDFREELQRISIDSVRDWTRVKDDYRSAAMAALEERIRTQGLASQREALITHLDQFIEQTFGIAKPNLRVNGRNFEDLEADEDVEPFDEALDRHIWSLADNRLNWHTRLADARQTRPTAIAATIKEAFTRHAERDALEPPPLLSDITEAEDVVLSTYETLRNRHQQLARSWIRRYQVSTNALNVPKSSRLKSGCSSRSNTPRYISRISINLWIILVLVAALQCSPKWAVRVPPYSISKWPRSAPGRLTFQLCPYKGTDAMSALASPLFLRPHPHHLPSLKNQNRVRQHPSCCPLAVAGSTKRARAL